MADQTRPCNGHDNGGDDQREHQITRRDRLWKAKAGVKLVDKRALRNRLTPQTRRDIENQRQNCEELCDKRASGSRQRGSGENSGHAERIGA